MPLCLRYDHRDVENGVLWENDARQEPARIPPPRRHRLGYHGVLAPNSPLRAAATAYGRDVTDDPSAPAEVAAPPAAPAPNARSSARYLWAMLLARLFESLPLVCPNCGVREM